MGEVKKRPFAAVKALFIALFASLVLSLGVAFMQAPEKAYAAEADKYLAEISIEGYGVITVELDRKAAPITVDNFVKLANEGFYNGLTFHRIERNFVIQGGDPKGDGTGGSGTNIKGEFAANGYNNPIKHVRGTISMARSGDANSGFDTASSQFFIVQTTSAGNTASLDGKYAAFGKVISGMDIVDKIVNYKYQDYDQLGQVLSIKPKISSIKVTPCAQGGWKKSGGKYWYQYKTPVDGKTYPANTTIAINGKYYTFDSRGYMRTGWVNKSGTWYYHGGKNDGAMKTGWQKVGGKWYYLDSTGVMQTGKKSINSKTYYLEGSGAMRTGWSSENGKWYYYKPGSGEMLNGTLTWVRNGHYMFDWDGSMKTGLQKVKDDHYYFSGSGKMMSGWHKIDGNWRYFFDFYGVMMKSRWIGSYWVDKDGVMSTNAWVDGNRYYVDGNGKYAKKCWRLIDGKYYYFEKNGKVAKNKWISGKYWVGSDGVMATDAWVDGNRYYVDGNGVWVKNATRAAAPSAQADESAITPQASIPATDDAASTEIAAQSDEQAVASQEATASE